MLKLAIFAIVFTLANAQDTQNAQKYGRIQRCYSYDLNIDQCFVRNGNLAISDINKGLIELDLPPLQGFDFGDVFIGLNQSLSFLLEDVKGYLGGIDLTAAHLHFDDSCDWSRVDLNFTLKNAGWVFKYRALGAITDNTGSHKVNEKGNATIYFGDAILTFSIDLKRTVINGINYLRAVAQENAGGSHQKFDFQAKDQTGHGLPLGPDRFQDLRHPIIEKATEVCVKAIVYVFNLVLQDIPEEEIFLD